MVSVTYMRDEEEIRLFLDRYPRLAAEQFAAATARIDGNPVPVCPLPTVRGVIEAHDATGTVALHVMAVFDPSHSAGEPRLLFEYFSRGCPDPQGIPPTFFSIGARDLAWAELLRCTHALGLLDRTERVIVIALESDQMASVGQFLLYAAEWCARMHVDPLHPYPEQA